MLFDCEVSCCTFPFALRLLAEPGSCHVSEFSILMFADIIVSSLSCLSRMPCGNLARTFIMDTNHDQQTHPNLAEVVTFVCDGDISIKDGVNRLVHLRQGGTWEQNITVTSALRSFAHNPDRRIGFVTQRVLLEQLNDDLWRIFTRYYEERKQVWREYNEIALHTQNPTTPDQVSDQIRVESMGPRESPTQMQV